MKTVTDFKELIKENFPQLIMVFSAFVLMILMGGFFVGNILRSRLQAGAEEALYTAEANIKAGLTEAEITLLNSYYIVRGMMEQGADQKDVLDYLTTTTGWMRQREGGLLGFYGIYGYIRGEFIDSIGLNPDKSYIPQRRPWYQTAVRSGDSVGYTAPYTDSRTGEIVISAVRNINNSDGEIYGILAVDVNITWLKNYISSLTLAPGGYGIFLSQNMTLMTHPDEAYMGRQMEDMGREYSELARELRTGQEVSASRITDIDGTAVIVFFRRIFNDWYVGLITPYHRFYQDLMYAVIVLSVLGLLLAVGLSYMLLRLGAAKMQSDEESKSKSSFLARMSHEIRTPMNAIIGMSELALREGLAPRARDYVVNIRRAGDNLLSIINDILDFSKIESGKLEILRAEFFFASLLNDVISIIRARLNEKPILFVTRIEGSLPSSFIGDEARLRQVLLNLLGNAIKYTREGHICLSIKSGSSGAPDAWDIIPLILEISDTGIGIKPEDIGKLFGDFSQVDMQNNRGIEGTGLGLAISRSLCRHMGGDIVVESRYGEGSVFRVNLPMRVKDPQPFAVAEHPDARGVLVYETRRVYADSIVFTLENIGAGCSVAANQEDFRSRLRQGRYQFVFAAFSLFEEVREALDELAPDTTLILLAGYGEAARPDVYTLAMPIQPLSAANILNGKMDDSCYLGAENQSIRFIAPQARILIVDDITTNLNVAEGLLAPYKIEIDCATGGLDAIRLAEENSYDIVFMDHMMPGMDGIEAAAAIRKLGRDMPIIALTANAVSGMREMFLEKGFTDYLSKPIEIAKLDEILAKWIPKSKQRKDAAPENPSAAPPLSSCFSPLASHGVDIQKGLAMTGGTEAGYRKVLSSFYRDALERMDSLRAAPEEKDLPLFTIQVHALKSACATIGAAELSEKAGELEAAGKAGNMPVIRERLAGFAANLTALAREIRLCVEPGAEEKLGGDDESPALYESLFRELQEALKKQNIESIDRLMAELEKKPLGAKTREALGIISDQVLIVEFEAAIENINVLFDKTRGD
ncbi:MAG: response regulator [Spirochaetales bacterium]|jgi:signal transduction histidine kinase/CheY-like chemotaxis protein|nr:response regulator [Spirochaetales bacterium]